MMESRHWENDRIERRNLIETIGGEGTVIYTTIQYDYKRKRKYRYEITDNAVLIVRAVDVDMVITKMIARPNRLKAYCDNLPKEVLKKSIEYTRKGYYI